MLPRGEIARRLFDIVFHRGKNAMVEEVRIGLGYAGVRLDDQRMGLAALLLHELPTGCSAFPDAGRLAGSKATSLLINLTEGQDPLKKALGLAAANAIIRAEVGEDERDTLSIMGLTPEDHVTMVGLFTPMVPKIERTGAKLTVI
ncbi:MAG: enolase N-terminal-like fold-containing protein, partial [Syntrophales bacterium]